jgi:FixJ family two-component response regulator
MTELNASSELRVAVVEDDASVRRALSNLLRSAGMLCDGYEAAEDLLSQAELANIGCVVFDLRLQAMSGLELALELRQRDPSLPLVCLSAKVEATVRARLLTAGVIALLSKPSDADELLDTLRSHARKP